MRTSSGRAHSILAQLVAMHRETGKPHQYLIDRFAQERFLYRLSSGSHSADFVLKGGLMLTAVTDRFYRATRDIDVRAFAANDPETIKLFVAEAIAHEVDDDGMTFDTSAMKVERIRTHGEERGLRVGMPANLGRARAHIQLDMGFDDPILLPTDAFEYPVLLPGYPAPVLRAYSNESIIAEKLEAIANLDWQTTRYKDFDDVLELANRKTFDVSTLWLAIKMTFDHRGTELGRLMPAIGEDRATTEREIQYRRYRNREDVEGEATNLAAQLERLRTFVGPLVRYDIDGIRRTWEHGQWQTK